jgi:transcriptional regulator with XRE-family HTH domain
LNDREKRSSIRLSAGGVAGSADQLVRKDRQAGRGVGVGGRLRAVRLERGLSQRELAAPGVSYAYISRIEVGQRNPSVKALRKLAAALGVAPEWLETGIEPSRWSGFDKDELRLLARSLRAQIGNERAASLASEIECERRERARS